MGVEQSPGTLLAKICADIAGAGEKNKRVSRIEKELREKSGKLFEQASQILRECGRVYKNAGSEAGGKTGSYLGTPTVSIGFEDKKAGLILTEDFFNDSGFPASSNLIVLTARFDEKPIMKPKQIFRMTINGIAQNWLVEPATIKQMNMIKRILSFMQESLPKVNR